MRVRRETREACQTRQQSQIDPPNLHPSATSLDTMASSSSSSSFNSPHPQQLSQKSAQFRGKIASEIGGADDPLALYDQFVKWAFDKYPPEYIGSSGLLETL